MTRFTDSMVRRGGARRGRGFTLIELMTVVAIIAILASIAIPSYREQVRKGRRSEAMNALQSLALRQERWRANNPLYATAAQLGTLPTSSYYTFTVPANTATAYTLRASAAGAQTSDSACATMELTNAGVKTPAACWSQ